MKEFRTTLIYIYIWIYIFTVLWVVLFLAFLLHQSPSIKASQTKFTQIHQTQSNSSQDQLKAKLKINTREANLIQIPTQQFNNPVFFQNLKSDGSSVAPALQFVGRPSVEVVFPQQGSIFIPAHLRVLHVTQEAIILEKSPWRNLHLGFGLSLEMWHRGGA